MRTGTTSLPARLALIALGLILALLVGELLLQAGAAVVRWSGREVSTAWTTGKRRIVSLGDSNTYGIYVEPDESYPRVLDQLIAESPGMAPSEVLNLGFPGTNSSKVLHTLPRILRELRPDVVLLMVGTNDSWTEPEPDPGAAAFAPTLSDLLYRHSRMYRLLDMIGRSLAREELSVVRQPNPDGTAAVGEVRIGDAVFDWRWRKRKGSPHWNREFRANLRAIIRLCRERGVDLVLLTYPSEARTYGRANQALREEAAAAGVPLVDLGAYFAATCAEAECPHLFYGDHHPRAPGYRLAAERIRDWLAAPRRRAASTEPQ